VRPAAHARVGEPERIRLRHVAAVQMGQSPPGDSYGTAAQAGLPFLQGTADFGRPHPVPRVYCSNPGKVASSGDILFSVRAPVGELNMADREFCIGRGLCAVRVRHRLLRSYAWWALHAVREQLRVEATGSTFDAVTAEEVGDLRVPVPPRSQQRAIADFLDRETARIDRLIAEKERVLHLVAEKRQAVITQAVTRGLDPKAPLRASGVEWLGEIPAHWDALKIAYFARVGNGCTPARDNASYWEGGSFPWLNSAVVNNPTVGDPPDFVTDVALRECHLPLVEPNSVLVAITGQGKTRGKASLLTYRSTINQHMAYITPNATRAAPRFVQLALTAAYDVLRFISDDTGSTKGALTCEQICHFKLALPPPHEQEAIRKHLDAQVTKLDALHTAATETIGLLRERRAALIAAAVTGAIDVRGEVT